MASSLTRNDLQEELQKLTTEVRVMHRNLQKDLLEELRSSLEKISAKQAAFSHATSAQDAWFRCSSTPLEFGRRARSAGQLARRGGSTRSDPQKSNGYIDHFPLAAPSLRETADAPKHEIQVEKPSNKEDRLLATDIDKVNLEQQSDPGLAQSDELSAVGISAFALVQTGGPLIRPGDPPFCVPEGAEKDDLMVVEQQFSPITNVPRAGIPRTPPKDVKDDVSEKRPFSPLSNEEMETVMTSGMPIDVSRNLGNRDSDYFGKSTRSGSTHSRKSRLSFQAAGSRESSSAWLPQTYKSLSSIDQPRKQSIHSSHSAPFAQQKGRKALRRQATDLSEFLKPKSTVARLRSGDIQLYEAMQMFFKGDGFDYFMGIFLFLNAISIGLGVEVMCRLRDENEDEPPTWLRVSDGAFCLIFLTELLIRVSIHRTNYLRMDGWQWNMFDILVVGFSLIDEFSKLFLVGTSMQETIDSMGVLRMLRLGRVIRLVRMVRLIPELKAMVYLILSSVGAFFWTLVLLLLLIYCVAVYYTETSNDLILKDKLTDSGVVILKDHYGDVFTTTLSLFMAITGGDDWRNFVDVFKGDGGSYVINVLGFVLYISFVTLVMLNLVTGVFVEGAARIVSADKEAEIIRNVRNLFHLTDTDQSGEISWEEFEAQLSSARMQYYLQAVDMNTSQAKGLFKLLDQDRSGELSVEEFIDGVLRLRVSARSVDLQILKYDFEEIILVWAAQFEAQGRRIEHIEHMLSLLLSLKTTSNWHPQEISTEMYLV